MKMDSSRISMELLTALIVIIVCTFPTVNCKTYKRLVKRDDYNHAHCSEWSRCIDNTCPKLGLFCVNKDGSCSNDNRRCENTAWCVMDGVSCPGDPECGHMQKSCGDGTCVFTHLSCDDHSEGCLKHQRRCNSGLCIDNDDSTRRCLEDPCPKDEPFRCTSVQGFSPSLRTELSDCLPLDAVCDGLEDCVDGSDEVGCDGHNKEWFFLLFLLIIPALCSGYWFYRCCERKTMKKKAPRHHSELNPMVPLTNLTGRQPHDVEKIVIQN